MRVGPDCLRARTAGAAERFGAAAAASGTVAAAAASVATAGGTAAAGSACAAKAACGGAAGDCGVVSAPQPPSFGCTRLRGTGIPLRPTVRRGALMVVNLGAAGAPGTGPGCAS